VCCYTRRCYNSYRNCDLIFFIFLNNPTTATEIVISYSSSSLTIPNGRYDLVIIDAIVTKPYFSVHKTFLELKIYHIIVTCVNPLCFICYIIIFSLCIFSLCHYLKTNLFISNVLSTFLCWIQKKSLFD